MKFPLSKLNPSKWLCQSWERERKRRGRSRKDGDGKVDVELKVTVKAEAQTQAQDEVELEGKKWWMKLVENGEERGKRKSMWRDGEEKRERKEDKRVFILKTPVYRLRLVHLRLLLVLSPHPHLLLLCHLLSFFSSFVVSNFSYIFSTKM